MKKCDYKKEELEQIVKECFSIAEVLRRLGLKECGGNFSTIKRKLTEFQIDVSHFTGRGWNVYGNPNFGKGAPPLKNVLDVNSSLSSGHLKSRLFNNHLKENKCECCGISEWMGKPIQCELHHINGDSTDNRLENLMILCPNCHSQTENFRRQKRSLGKSAQGENPDVEVG